MTEYADLQASAEYRALLAASTRLGRDPLQVQGPGGNTSLKSGSAMWIKASGTWLADAEAGGIMVPVHAGDMRTALGANDPRAEEPSNFVAEEARAAGLRASIETPVHALLPWSVVLHTHCVSTIAVAVRTDAEAVAAERLSGMNAIFVPYVKPGAELARSIHARLRPNTRVIVLGNHGLIACGNTVSEAEAALLEASRRLAPERIAPDAEPDPGLAARLLGTGWIPAPDRATQAIARDPARLALARGSSLYPDHLVFLGPGVLAAPRGADPGIPADREPRRGIVMLEGEGAAIRKDASRPTRALVRCLGDVIARMDPNAPVVRLREADEFALLNWDAEKQRQALNTQAGEPA